MPKLIFFDCDGVLADSEILSARVTSEILSEHGLTLSEEETNETFAGKSLKDNPRIVLEAFGIILPDGYVCEHERRLMKLFRTDLKAIDGVVEFLEDLKTPICVTSNSGHSRLAVTLAVTNLARFFGKNVFSAEDVTHGKPSPDLFQFAAKAFGVDPSECVTIDDSLSGIQGAVAAGTRAIGFSGGSHINNGHDEKLYAAGAEIVVGHMSALGPLLANG